MIIIIEDFQSAVSLVELLVDGESKDLVVVAIRLQISNPCLPHCFIREQRSFVAHVL